MIAIFRTSASSIFASPISDCQVGSNDLADHPITHHVASDDWCEVHGFAARTGAHLSAGDPAGPAGLAWLLSIVPVLNDHFNDAGGYIPIILECWTTFGGAHWALVEWSTMGECARFLVFEGRRGQFNEHQCGWVMPIRESLDEYQWCALWTTHPASALDERWEFHGFDGEGRVYELPRPPGWRDPTDDKPI